MPVAQLPQNIGTMTPDVAKCAMGQEGLGGNMTSMRSNDMLNALQFTQRGKICKAVVLTEAGKVGRTFLVKGT